MADNLRTRVARVIAGGAHALLDKLEDAAPAAVLDQSAREIERVIQDVRAELGRVVANRHLAQQQHLRLNREHDLLSESIAAAISGHREDLATTGIARQLDIEAQLPILEASLGEWSRQDKELSGFIDALMGKQREMQKTVQDVEAAWKPAPTRAFRQTVAATFGDKAQAVQSAFDRTYQRQAELAGKRNAGSQEHDGQLHELSQLVRDHKISERLASLKAGH